VSDTSLPVSQNTTRVIYQMAKADFLERVRRYSFLMTLAAALYLAYGVITEKVTIVVGDGYRGVYNSAWIGMLMAICCSTFLTLVGFYVVKNSVERDSKTRVGRILAATPMSKVAYTVAKTLSNFAVLASMVLVLMIAAVAMQWLRPEARPISLWELWAPFLLIALPAMFVAGSIALLFETLPILRGGVGNVIYFFVWTFGLAMGSSAKFEDPAGVHILESSTDSALQRVGLSGPHSAFRLTIGGDRAYRTFAWDGVDWTPHLIAVRLSWLLVGLGFAVIASVFFHRFDPARDSILEKAREKVRDKKDKRHDAVVEDLGLAASPGSSSSVYATLTALGARGHNRFLTLLISELSLMVKGQRWWWYIVAAGLLVAQFVSPTADARGWVLLVAWLWPVLVWSQMGCRESRHSTQSLIFSAERILFRQLAAVWTAGVIVALVTGSGAGIRLLIGGNWRQAAAWCAGAMFIPSLALALGVWSGSSKLFEAVYIAWWYIGPLHQLPSLDFIGGSAMSSSPGTYLMLTAGLLLAAGIGRRRQVAYA
jgi:hypothetical protein